MKISSFAVRAAILNRDNPTEAEQRPTKMKEPVCVIDIPEDDNQEYHPSKEKLYREGRHKPLLRGVLHEIQFVCWPIYAYLLLKGLHRPKSLFAGWLFLLSYAICFGSSSQYHRRKWWSNEAEKFMQRLDYCGIFFIICGSYSVPSLLLLGETGKMVLCVMWSGCLYGCWRVLVQNSTSNTVAYIIVGSSLFPWISELLKELTDFEAYCAGISWTLLFIAVLIFSSGKCDLSPNIFGYHEVFHVFISSASIFTYLCTYSIIRRYESQPTLILS
mmetsp:Transcript_1390/g.1890  ORF Transcript_1390/g.1890 Transcript_1390/m.1890 type:complete len:273 (+) Transcript_1390:135-953(+)